ncbi:MAG TPA: hypothetical protein VNH64_05410 [Parvularculaceae bacterium]|nr:hypothetical protein [Parvularculaceae bacterium]
MRIFIIATLLFAASAAGGAVGQVRQTPILRTAPVADTSSEGAAFTAHCTDILRIVGGNSSFSFMCKTSEGGTQMFSVMKGEDSSGSYPVGHDPQTQTALGNLYGAGAISQAVTTFVMVKTVNPASGAILELHGISSKLPAAKGAPAVTSATLILN